jgi:flagellar export protein FliJ
MKQFVFTLQSFYDMKLSEEEQQKIRMQMIIERLFAQTEELSRMKKAFNQSKQTFCEKISRGLKSDELAQYNRYFSSLTEGMMVQKERIAKTEKEKEKCLKEQIEIKKEIKTLDKLRESQYEAYQYGLKLEEEKEIGDLVSYKVASK